MSSNDYNGVKPTTDSDKEMAEDHLKRTKKIIEDKQDLEEDKIDDHKKALKDALKARDKRSANYNRSHIEKHEHDIDDDYNDKKQIDRSLSTLSTLHTHSRKTYNDVRKAKVKLMYIKSGSK
jgi:hypothetical protein